jgi:hypothetical protein
MRPTLLGILHIGLERRLPWGPSLHILHFTFWGTLAPAAGALDHVEHLVGLECLDYIRSTPSLDPHRIPISQSIVDASCCRGYSTRGTLHTQYTQYEISRTVASADALDITDESETIMLPMKADSSHPSGSRRHLWNTTCNTNFTKTTGHCVLSIGYGRRAARHSAFKNGGMLRST